MFTVVDLAIRYRKPARLDDLLEVVSRARRDGRVTVVFEQSLCNEAGEVLVEGEVRVACVDAVNFRPRRLPAWLVAQDGGA